MYVVNNFNKALFEWSKTKWLKRSGAPVENASLWKELIALRKKIRKRVEIKWVKGHSKDQYNKEVDKLAKKSAKNPGTENINFVNVRRKTSFNSVSVGSVKMRGQRVSIRIITDQLLRPQKILNINMKLFLKQVNTTIVLI